MESRREFLKSGMFFAAAGTFGAGLASCPSPGRDAATRFDDSLSVLISDLHVGGTAYCGKYQEPKLQAVVAAILAMDPLPRNVVCFGDIAWTAGWRLDYQRSKPILQRLVDAGIRLSMTMGNHDRRSHFLESWPEYAKSSPVPGRIASVVPLAHADIVLLDALKGGDDRGEREMGPVEGSIGPEQFEWFKEWMGKAKRPFFLGTHQCSDLDEGKALIDAMAQHPLAAGWLHGHDHMWLSWSRAAWRRRRMIPILTLPSTGHWGDIGYVLFRTTPDMAVAELVQSDYFFSTPVPAEKRPRMWDLRIEDNRGSRMRFSLNG